MTSHHEGYTRLTFELPAADHKKLKALAALAGISMKDLILGCLKDNLLSENAPNEETKEGKNLIHYKSVNELIDKLNLK